MGAEQDRPRPTEPSSLLYQIAAGVNQIPRPGISSEQQLAIARDIAAKRETSRAGQSAEATKPTPRTRDLLEVYKNGFASIAHEILFGPKKG